MRPDAEVTTEANPESVDPSSLEKLRHGGFNRISFGMQSVREHVLQVLDRRHTPGRAAAAVREARAAGFEHVNLDLIYSTPGESDDDWRASLGAAIEAGPDHVSAYSLIVEEGTRLAARIRRGELPMPDDDVAADRYLIADELLSAAGFAWYEVSNWAVTDDARCRHNLLYWTGGDWWAAGPGAHSHVGGTRWWNVKHPAAYAQRLAAGHSPAHAREVLGHDDRDAERLMLELRLSSGYPLAEVAPAARPVVASALARGAAGARAVQGGPHGADPPGPAAGRRPDQGPAGLGDQADGDGVAVTLAPVRRHRRLDVEDQRHDEDRRQQQEADEQQHQERGHDVADEHGDLEIQRLRRLVPDVGRLVLAHHVDDERADPRDQQAEEVGQHRHGVVVGAGAGGPKRPGT
ncbi:hypothetical protein GCM10020001_072810 [Nonomuraea salmonea]